MTEPIISQREGEIVTITLHRPDRLNAINAELARALKSALLDVGHDASVRAVVLTGSGRAFCAGGDLREFHEMGDDIEAVFYEVAGVFHESILEMRRMPKPVIAAIHGPAAGGGLSLALACDFRVMCESAFLQMAYNSNGLSIDGGGTHTLLRYVGLAKALELTLLDERIDAAGALNLGLVHRVADSGQLDRELRNVVERLLRIPSSVVGRTKDLFHRSFENSLERQLEEERRHIAASAAHPDGQAGIAAFLSKRWR